MKHDVAARAKVRADALYSVLDRMVDAKWLTDGWELVSEANGSREERRWFELTPDGRSNIEGCLSAIDRIVGTEGAKP